ncbi:energy transducer TonB [Sphingomonas qomolangmaensis]|uniref:Energy transducer TonB n=1 Tax=Sphingomonas qomolangmaensis TaxID=2918765 RepID=A0ABY5LDT0_9SPHN|nr:energy transducer TonB [Sphingomonas qomolangmaensis]UUL83879.1 energy transducer TonB [Sphingomonas qomolangmaensis]
MTNTALVSSMAIAIASVMAGGAAAQEAAPKPMTAQARFDAATAASEAGKCAEAVAQFESIEQLPVARREGFLKSAIAVRKGRCLARLGRGDEAEGLIRQGLPAMAAAGGSFDAERQQAHLTLAGLARARLDYDAAILDAEAALARSQGVGRLSPLLMLTTLTRFDGGGAAIGYAKEALALAQTGNADKKVLAQIQTQQARAMLNQGQAAAAYPLLKEALANQGGLTMQVGLAEVATRADLAVAASLLGKKEEAGKYLAYTGAGRIADAPFRSAASMDAPFCGETTGLKPEDVGVVEFAIGEDGSVLGVEPIYATGGRAGALAFAEAVTQWSWAPEQIKEVPLFYRAATRIEMRCTTGADDGGSVMEPLDDAVAAWLDGKVAAGVDPQVAAARQLPLWRAALANARAAGDQAGEFGASWWLATSQLVEEKERQAHLARAAALAAAMQAPASVRGRLALEAPEGAAKGPGSWRRQRRALLAEPRLAADPLTAATLRLQIAAPGYGSREPEDAEALLDAVIEEPALPAQHPLKIAALLRRANLSAKAGDLVTAQAQFQQTGLTEQQCALIGVKPALRDSGMSPSDYPVLARKMGFEGWVSLEFDVAADGSTVRPRALFAYPPFTFGDTAVAGAKDFKFETSYRPSGGTACAANRQGIAFALQ